MAEGDVGSDSKLSDALTKKLGPLPGYVWVGLAVGGFLVYRKLHGSSSSSTSGPAVPAAGSDTPLTGNGLDTGGAIGGGGVDPNAGSGAGTFFDPAPITGLTDAINSLLAAQTQPQSNASPYINSAQPGTIFIGQDGRTYAQQPSGAFEPAYVGPQGSYVSPLTYEGAGATPQPITSSMVAPPVQSPGPSLPTISGPAPIPAHTAAIAPSALGGGGGGGRPALAL